MNTSHFDAIGRAAKLLGSQKALAQALSVTTVTVSQWFRAQDNISARPIPVKQCVRIERLTQGQVTRQELRPDDYFDIWPELAVQPVDSAGVATETIAQGVVNV